MTQNKKRLGLSIPISLYDKLLDKAKFQGKTLNSLCLEIFWEYFESKEAASVMKENKMEVM